MPAHRQQKCTIPKASDSLSVQRPPLMPNQQKFRQHLRALARGAIRMVLEGVMREELYALSALAGENAVPNATAIATAITSVTWSRTRVGSRT